MERFQVARETARKNIRIADHMLTITYPMVKDPKLLLAVLENIFLSLTNAMGAVLYHERLFKRIPPFHDTFESKYNMFVAKVVPKYGIDRTMLNVMVEIKDILLEHKKSPVEFTRQNKFVICSDSYNMKTISLEQLKAYIAKTKVFVEQMARLTEKHEEIFR
jgi:hypothetical protein